MSNWSLYLNRSAKILKENASKVARMDGLATSSEPKTLFTLRSQQDLAQFINGCDADIGGKSSCKLDLGPDGRGRFWGDMRLGVQSGLEGRLRSGYAGFRNKSRPTLFGEIMEDLSLHRYLALRVRAGGEPKTRSSYFVNIQTDTPIQSDLWQHRLFFRRDDGDWEDVFIPLDNFVLTNSGDTVPRQIAMRKIKVRTVGVSILGGNAQVEGRFELGIDSIRAVNEMVNEEDFLAADAPLPPTDGQPAPTTS